MFDVVYIQYRVFLCWSAISISKAFLILWLGIIFYHFGFTVFLQTFTCIPELENELGIVFISQPPFPSAGLSGVNSKHDNCIIKPLPTHNLKDVSTHKPKSAFAILGVSLPLLLFSLLLFYGILSFSFSPLPYEVVFLSFLNFWFPISLIICIRKDLKSMCTETETPLRTQCTEWIHLY